MTSITIKSIIFFVLTLCSFSIRAQNAPPSDGVFRLQNVATGKFLTDTGSSATSVIMTDSGEAENTHFKFVQSGSFYNIDSEILGILRAPGASGPGGAYVIVSTTKASPASDTDKTWTIYHNDTNDTYRFGSRTTGRFMYHDENGTVTHAVASDTDDRSNWKLILYVQTAVEIASDEDISSDISCSDEFRNATRTSSDLANRVNVGTIDDRSCYSDYSESTVNDKTWGIYNITDDSNHLDTNGLQPRIERSLSRSSKIGIGSYAKFNGTFRILEVANSSGTSQDGTYIAQAKGKHTGGGGSSDPAISLFLAKPVFGAGINAGKQVAFDIYMERILERGGEGSGREIVFLKTVEKNVETSFDLKVGFAEDPNDSSKKIHYCNAIIGGEEFNWNIPEPERGLESGIRYGAYRVKGGRAQIRWANTTYEKKEFDEVIEVPDVASKVYSLKNVATGKFLKDAGVSATPVSVSDTDDMQNTHWTFVESGSLFNIDSESFGIIRATGSSFSGGANAVVSTTKAAPASDGDKVWTLHYNDSDETYRFEAGTSGRYLYHDASGNVTNISTGENDDRSKWKAILKESLDLDKNEVLSSKVSIYPNPTNSNFIIDFNSVKNAEVKVMNMLGKTIYKSKTSKGSIKLSREDGFSSGLYIIQVLDENGGVSNKKLIIR